MLQKALKNGFKISQLRKYFGNYILIYCQQVYNSLNFICQKKKIVRKHG